MGRIRDAAKAMFSRRETFDTAPTPIDKVIMAMKGSIGGGYVSKVDALSIPAVQKGRNLICSIATLPLVQLDKDLEQVRHPLLEQIDPNVPNVVTISMTVEDLLFEGISWWRITKTDFDGYPVSAEHLDTAQVSFQPPGGDRNESPLPSGEDPRFASVWVDGVETPSSKLIRFDSPNPAFLKVGGRAVKRAILLDQAANMYATDPRPADYFTPSDTTTDPADDETIKSILGEWIASRKERSTAYVPAALKYNVVDVPSPADLQLVELQKRVSLEIANALGVDPEDLGISTTSRTYQNATDRRQDRINEVLAPFMRAVEHRLSMGDVTKRGYRVVFDLDDYLRADPLTRAQVAEIHLRTRTATRNEVRKEEGLPKLPGGDTVDPPAAATPTPQETAVQADKPASQTFDADTNLTFVNMPSTTFSVDTAKRTITGLAVPYGKVASKNMSRFRFAAGSLQWGDMKRVKLLRDHDYSQALGRATALTETPEGLVATFFIGTGPQGDQALALAAEGILDGLSIGVDFTANDMTKDPMNSGVNLVNRADLREVSLTAMPAFDDARLTRVTASRDEGDSMRCSMCGVDHAAGVACTPTPAPAVPDVAAFMAAMTTAFQAQTPTPAPVIETEGPMVIQANRRAPNAIVTEAAPYRLDFRGGIKPGSHDFSQDLVKAQRGDAAAHDRALGFIQAQFDVDKADAASLNPTRNRPDMYVDQLDYSTPLWDLVGKGTLDDITPFTVPKFSSSSGLVSPHVEGVEPTAGTFVATAQTITPSALSGKVEITREAWDQGGNPQLSTIIWNQMKREWFEDREAAIATFLNTLTAAVDIPLTAGETDADLTNELEAAIAALQFVRGGNRFSALAVHVDLYKALAAATDLDDRKIYAALGPSNSSGTAASLWGSLNINGTLAVPSWALGATGSAPANSWLFDPSVVLAWYSAPQRLEFNYRVAYVDLAIWGYVALANTRIDGVRQVIYDPVA